MDTITLAREIRCESLKMVHAAKASHVAGALSIADVLAVLYNSVLNIIPAEPHNPNRDYLVYSKGHTCVALYSTLALMGYFDMSRLKEYGEEGSEFISHVSSKIPGVEFSTGSLGHGLPFSCGIALAFHRLHKPNKVYCIVGDGEMDEGSNWEAILFAAQHRLNNLCLIIDYNKMQAMGSTKEILDLENLENKMSAFGWAAMRIDGHDISQIESAFKKFTDQNLDRPYVIICDTVKGKGVSFMEDNLRFHYAPPSDEELEIALNELSIS